MNGRLNAKIVRRFKESFAADCIQGILLGYAKMKGDNKYECFWIEDKLTAHLVCKMRETGFFIEKDIFIAPQAPLYDDDVIYGEGDPAKSPRIDFKFGRNWSKAEYNYFAEAKNLSEKNWLRSGNKNPIRADKQNKRYIETGIDHYLSGYYPEGCLIGYVVNGDVSGVLSNLNRTIADNKTSPQVGLIERDNTAVSDCCYISQNKLPDRVFALRHLLLQLA